MEILSEECTDGVVRRRFDLTVDDRIVPGVHWWPEGAEPRPTVLVGHGGFQSKEAPNVVELAVQLAHERGFATIALDAPGHGDRRTPDEAAEQEAILERIRAEGIDRTRRNQRDRVVADQGGWGVPRMVNEWKALLDELEKSPSDAGTSYGYWGVSMGCRHGIPLVATEPRIVAATLGLFGLLPDPDFEATVRSISIPLLFLFQYDDELMTPQSGLDLWAAFGSEEKTMHLNPGPHVGIPRFERDAASAFFARHLG